VYEILKTVNPRDAASHPKTSDHKPLGDHNGNYLEKNKTGNIGITNIEARSCNHCCSGKAMSITYCMCSFRYPACNAHAPYCHLRPAPLYHIFPRNLINGTISEKKLLNIKCVC